MRHTTRSAPPRGRHRWRGLAVALLGIAFTASACGDDTDQPRPETEQSRPVVAATTSIWADVVHNIACDGGIDIDTIIPLGGDSHSFEPSLADRARLDNAALIVANGLHLEEGIDDIIDAVENTGTAVFRIGEHIDTSTYGNRDDDNRSTTPSDDHDHAGDDPHVWFDPIRVSAALPTLGAQLVAHTGLDASTVEACVAEYQSELAALDAAITDMVSQVPHESRKLVTNHDALGYFADRYGFEIIGTVIPGRSGLAQTNPAQLEALATTIRQAGVKTIFADTHQSTDDARALARRLGDVTVTTLRTGTLGGPDSPAGTYLDFLHTNASLITNALR